MRPVSPVRVRRASRMRKHIKNGLLPGNHRQLKVEALETRRLLTGPDPGNLFLPVQAYGSGGSTPDSIAVADFNSDGFLDVAVTNNGSQAVGVLMGQASGGFAKAKTFPTTGTNPSWVVTSDFNGDGKKDLAIGHHMHPTKIDVQLGKGDGTFALARTITLSTRAIHMAVDDLNRDGKSDLIVTSYDVAKVGVLLGTGDGDFTSPQWFSSGAGGTAAFTIGDFNADGHRDLAVYNWPTPNTSVGILLGKGDGTFRDPVTYACPYSGAYSSLTAGDVNGDGKSDLAIASQSNQTVDVWLGRGDGSFQPTSTYKSAGSKSQAVAIADFNRDGLNDLAVNNMDGRSVGILLNKGAGLFGTAVAYDTGGGHPSWPTVADFNRDGNPDLAIANDSSANIGILVNSSPAAAVHYVIAAMGDSYAAGQGNPATRKSGDVPATWLTEGISRDAELPNLLTIHTKGDNASYYRSPYAASVVFARQVATTLVWDNPGSSFDLVFAPQSGATMADSCDVNKRCTVARPPRWQRLFILWALCLAAISMYSHCRSAAMILDSTASSGPWRVPACSR